jgi:predicted RNase H-like HicB family nuclease
MNFPVVLHKDADSDYGVTVPDLPGCFSAGRTIDEALNASREAIELHLEGLAAAGHALPLAGQIDDYQARREYRGGIWAVVSVAEDALRGKVVRLNVTMPERVVDAVDRYAAAHGETRSGLLARAVSAYIGRPDDSKKKKSKG